MSNYLAIATVTAALDQRMRKVIPLVSGNTVTTTRPDQAAKDNTHGPWINIFLYQVAPNTAYRNDDLPTRNTNGNQLLSRPKAALVLRYLISVAGNDGIQDAHILLGAVIRDLHGQPKLDPTEIASIKVTHNYLATSDLDDQTDFIRFTPLNLNTEEISKLWSTFFEIPYILSVAYEASPVLIEPEDTPVQALPVQARNLYVLPFRQPHIDAVVSDAGDDKPVFLNSTLLIKGRQLKGDDTHVLMSTGEYTPAAGNLTDTLIRLAVPAGTPAGVQGLQVIQKILMGTPATAHPGVESNAASFILHPKVILPVAKVSLQDHGVGPLLAGANVTVDVTVGINQRAFLLLNATDPNHPTAYRIPAQPLSAAGTVLSFIVDKVVAGNYYLRVTIDGADSMVGAPVTFPLP
jgi:hypothetical protein